MATIGLQEPTLQSRPSREDDTRQAGHIENPPRFQGKLKSLLIGVNHHAVVIRLPGIHSGPQTLSHNHLRARCRSINRADDHADVSLHSDSSGISQ